MKSEVYKQAEYYEIAFSFIESKKQADLFENFIKNYSKIKVKKILDLACGTSLQLRELAKRNYLAIGLDCNQDMIGYLKRESSREGLKVEVVRGDMNKFQLEQKVDFAYIMMGSIIYVRNNDLFFSHLDSVANSLNKGGLYLIENLAINWADPSFFKSQSWTMKRGGIKVKTIYRISPKNALKQIVVQELRMEVNDHGKKMTYEDRDELKIIFPEEFKLLVEKNGKFEFIDYFERERVKVLKMISPDNIALLRKK